jgi:succinate-acetate transporter protein
LGFFFLQAPRFWRAPNKKRKKEEERERERERNPRYLFVLSFFSLYLWYFCTLRREKDPFFCFWVLFVVFVVAVFLLPFLKGGSKFISLSDGRRRKGRG